MNDLIAKLEAASEGNRELDLDIAIILGDFVVKNDDEYENALFDKHGMGYGTEGQWKHFEDQLPHYTTSLDAALTLVPEGWEWQIFSDDQASVFKRPDSGGGYSEIYDGENPVFPALALAIAALKTRVKQKG